MSFSTFRSTPSSFAIHCLAAHQATKQACPTLRSQMHSIVQHLESYGRIASYRIRAAVTAWASSPFLHPRAPSNGIWPIASACDCLVASNSATDLGRLASGQVINVIVTIMITNQASGVHHRPSTDSTTRLAEWSVDCRCFAVRSFHGRTTSWLFR